MNLFSKTAIRAFLAARELQPSKRLGQNFLIDKGAIKKIIEAAELNSDDTVLEIGPGLGVLTQELTKRVKMVIAVEKDPKMIEILKETLGDFNNMELIQKDIRNFESEIKDYKVMGNLPFYLAAPVIRKFLESERPPKEMVLVVQKEVGQRICSKPPDMNLLAVSVQFYAEPKIISYISKKSFWPSPEVDAAIIKIIPRLAAIRDRDLFFKIVKAGFSQPRKQLINNLSRGLKIDKKRTETWLLKNNIKPIQRAETLNVNDWIALTKTFGDHLLTN